MNAGKIDELIVLFDAECALCRKARKWLGEEPQYVPLKFYPLQLKGVTQRFPGLQEVDLRAELTVLHAQGDYWRGLDAWLMVLWALEDWRERSIELAQPMWKPLARRLVIELSENRYWLSDLIERSNEEHLYTAVQAKQAQCDEGRCAK